MANLTATQLQSLSTGIATAMSNLQSRIEARILAETLPILGNRLADEAAAGRSALTVTEDLGAALSQRLATLAAGGTQTDSAVRDALESVLQAQGHVGAVIGISVFAGTVRITLGTSHTESYAQSLSGDLGFGGLDLEAEGNARVEATFGYDIEFGTSATGGGFFFDTSGAEEITLALRVDDLVLSEGVSIDGQFFEATDAGSVFAGDIAIDIAGIGGVTAQSLATADLAGDLAGEANMAIQVALTGGAELLPPVSAVFDIDWVFNSAAINPDNSNAQFGSAPVVVFRDVTMDLGGFMENFVAPLLNRVKSLVEPLEPIVEVLNANIRLLSDFPVVGDLFDVDGREGVTLIDLIALVTDIDPAPILALSDLITDVAEWVDLLEGLGFGEGNLVLGDFAIDDDIRSAAFNLVQAATTFDLQSGDDLTSIIAGLSGNGWGGGGRDILQGLTQTDGIFDLELLKNPGSWIDLLLGREVDLVEVDLPQISLGTNGPRTLLGPIPLFFGINLDVTGGVDVTVDLDFGFSTRGLIDPNLTALDGLYITDRAGPEIELVSSVGVNVALEAGLVGLDGGGDVRGEILMDLISGSTPGRVYFDEFGAALASNPFSIFDGQGEISLGFSAVLDTILGEIWRWESPRITLGSFSFGGSSGTVDPNLGAVAAGRLDLNIGTRAGNRNNDPVDIDTAERMELSLAPDGETLRINFLSSLSGTTVLTDSFTQVLHIVGDGGNFDDEIVLAEGLLISTELFGGGGNDVLSGGDSLDTLNGSDGNDVLFGYAGNDDLDGGLGNDFLNGGAGADTISGGGGTDRVSYTGSNAGVTINFSSGLFTGGDATGDTLTSIESVDGTDHADTITGAVGTGSFFGFGGHDVLSSGTLAMMLAGGDGNDRLIANGGGHTLVGGRGDDTYVVFTTTAILSENLLNEIPATGSFGGVDRVEAFVDFDLSITDSAIENLTLFNLAQRGTGNSFNNTLTGNVFDNTLSGAGGRDTLLGGGGRDRLEGGTGNDRLLGEADHDTLLGDAGNDTLFGGAGNDVLYGGDGNDSLDGAAGADFFAVNGGGDRIADSGDDGVDFVWATADYTVNAGQRLEILSSVSLLGQNWTSAWLAADRGAAFVALVDALTFVIGNLDANLTGSFREEVLIGRRGGTNTLTGLEGADTLIGDGANDTAGYAASDAGIDIDLARATQIGGHAQGDRLIDISRIIGSAFGDVINGSRRFPNPPAETFDGGAGNDRLIGQFGDHSLIGGTGNDTLYGGDGNDRLSGDNDRDTLYGGDGNDTLFGGAGNDILFGDDGNDQLDGGRGNDTYHVGSASDRVDEIGGTLLEVDTVIASASYVLAPLISVEILSTSNALGTGAINLTGNGLGQTITGNAGANRLNGGGGVDTLNGGAGNDVYVTDGGDQLVEVLLGGQDTVEASVSFVLASGFEDLVLTGSGAINGTGTAGANRITGNVGINVLAGLAGADTLIGVANNDTASYAASDAAIDILMSRATQLGGHAQGDVLSGITTVIGSAHGDVISGNAQLAAVIADTFYGGLGNDRLTGVAGADRLFGDSGMFDFVGGNDTLFGGLGDDLLYGAAGLDTLFGGDGRDLVDGGNDRDSLFGEAGNDTLFGGTGNDLLDGGAGSDRMDGGRGNDTYTVDAAGDQVNEFDGTPLEIDTVLAAVSFTLLPLVSVEVLATTNAAGTGAINLTGNGLSQTITGNAGANTLDGGGGIDTLAGGAGHDTLIVRHASTVIVEGLTGGASDTVATAVSFSLAADDHVERFQTTSVNGTATIHLTGNLYSQTITGNAGANRIDGKGSDDTLNGGLGADVFIFSTALGGSNVDRIQGYASASDQIEIDNAVFQGMVDNDSPLGSIAFTSNTSGLATQILHRIIHETDTGFLWFDRDGLGATYAPVHFATLDLGTALTASEFTVI